MNAWPGQCYSNILDTFSLSWNGHANPTARKKSTPTVKQISKASTKTQWTWLELIKHADCACYQCVLKKVQSSKFHAPMHNFHQQMYISLFLVGKKSGTSCQKQTHTTSIVHAAFTYDQCVKKNTALQTILLRKSSSAVGTQYQSKAYITKKITLLSYVMNAFHNKITTCDYQMYTKVHCNWATNLIPHGSPPPSARKMHFGNYTMAGPIAIWSFFFIWSKLNNQVSFNLDLWPFNENKEKIYICQCINICMRHYAKQNHV